MASGNHVLAGRLASLFGNSKQSDCLLEFGKEQNACLKRRKLVDGSTDDTVADDEDEVYGEPLPGHTLVLCNTSEWFRTRLESFEAAQQDSASNGDAQAVGQGTCGRKRPNVLRVPVGCAAEVPSARAAVRYMYTGEVQAASIREALEIWRQAHYLQVEGCADACLHLIKTKLNESAGSEPSTSSTAPPAPPILEFYSCAWMWSVLLDTDPSLVSVLNTAKPLLVSHFGDALAALNTPTLRQQLLALPPVAVEALLESDDFGTDTEDSVLLLLATWVQENRGKVQPPALQQLCRLVRLAQLSPAHANAILPGLAMRKASAPDTETSGWFEISPDEASAFSSFASIKGQADRERLKLAAGELYDTSSTWYSLQPRRQCVYAEESSADYEWYVTDQQLRQSLASLQPGGELHVFMTFTHGVDSIYARGFEWSPRIKVVQGSDTAGLFLNCKLPEAFKVQGTSLSGGKVAAVAQIDTRLEVYCWRGGVREDPIVCDYDARYSFIVGKGGGWPHALPLQQPAGQADDGGRDPLAPWSKYLHEGKIWGQA